MLVTDCLIGRKSLSANSAAALVELDAAVAGSELVPRVVVELATISGLCNDGEFDATTLHLPLERRRIFGDATDQAVLRFAETITQISDVRSSWITAHKVPFNSKNKFMVHVIEKLPTAHEKGATEPGDLVLTIKGAPDILLPWCTHYMTGQGRSEPLTDEHRCHVEETKNRWSSQAKRVILIARKVLGQKLSAMSTQSNEFDDQIMKQAAYGLELLGLVAIIDPPRDEIPDVIRTLRGAGIKVHMVTGDYELTATAIAVDCGIVTARGGVDGISALLDPGLEDASEEAGVRAIAVSGRDIVELNDEQWDRLCAYDEIVFARATPEHKLRIVKELQNRGEVVGSEWFGPADVRKAEGCLVTGDGVNDAPSLKAADIGIAMGSGSDLAIEAADMVLLDSFAAIVEAVRYGRVVFGPSHSAQQPI
jgi:sodium/potassium-transporting ATPase subunit alpha